MTELKGCCGRCEKRASGYNRPDIEHKDCSCPCHTPTVEPTDCCGKCEPGDSGLHTKCLLPSCECHSPTETGWEEKIPFQKHDKQCGYATCDSRVMIDFIRETLAIQKEELLKELEERVNKLIDEQLADAEGPMDDETYARKLKAIVKNGVANKVLTIIKNLKGVE